MPLNDCDWLVPCTPEDKTLPGAVCVAIMHSLVIVVFCVGLLFERVDNRWVERLAGVVGFDVELVFLKAWIGNTKNTRQTCPGPR